MRPESRGRLSLDAGGSGRPAAAASTATWREEGDRRRLREGVRLAAELLRDPGAGAARRGRTGLPDDVLADDRALDRWVRAHLTTAMHLGGTRPDGAGQ